MPSLPPRHDEIESFTDSAPGPDASDFNIAISIPEKIEIRMVDASSLSDYEIWFFSATALVTLFTGFLVASLQEADGRVQRVLSVVSLIFGILFLGTLTMTLIKRHSLRSKVRTIRFKTSRVADISPETRPER